MYDLKTAREQDLTQIYELYKGAIQKVNQGTVKLGWNIEIYPDLAFMKEAVAKEQMLIFCEGEKLLACGVVNHSNHTCACSGCRELGKRNFLEVSAGNFGVLQEKGRCSPAS